MTIKYLAVHRGKQKPRLIGRHKLAVHIPTARFIYEYDGTAGEARELIKAGRLLPRWREGMEVNTRAAEVLPEPVKGNGTGEIEPSTPEERERILEAARRIAKERQESK